MNRFHSPLPKIHATDTNDKGSSGRMSGEMVTSGVNLGGEAPFQMFPPVLNSGNPTIDKSYT
jgi:hypothetical protein